MGKRERRDGKGPLAKRILISSCILLLACSVPDAGQSQEFSSPEEKSAYSCSETTNGMLSEEQGIVTAVRKNVESGPLYSIPARAGVAKCSAIEQSGVITLKYRFRDGGSLHVKRDSSIEYSEQVAWFNLRSEEKPVAILKSAEHVAFGASGCGIDWEKAETQPSPDPNFTETLFYGDVCNCRAGFRRDAVGQVVELMFRSAC